MMDKEFFIRILSSFLLVPVAFFFIFKGSFFFNFFIIVILLITLYEWHFLSSNKSYYIPGFIFIIFSFYTFYFLRNESSYFLFLLIIITCISTDVGGYIFGKILKGPKITKISPNKTYAGMLGGFVLSLLVASLFLSNLNIFSLSNAEYPPKKNIMIVVLCISFISQIGDLIISFFKRKSKVKNTGKIIPGHGGILDRIDGMLFAYPFIYISTKIL